MSEQFVSILNLLLKDEILNAFTFNKAIRSQHGVANEVYCLEFNEIKLMLKIYKNIPDADLSDYLIDMCRKNGLNVPIILKCGTYLGQKYVLTKFIEGNHIYEIDDEIIRQIINLAIKIPIPNLTKVCKKTIYNKTNLYYETLKKKKETKLPYEYIEKTIAKYETIICKINMENLFIVHGDISPTNLLWNNRKFTAILDFDETILAPAEYEVIVTIIKFCKKNNFFDVSLAKKMAKQYIEMSKSNSIDRLCMIWNLYIIKVLLEKFYLHELNIIDLYEERQLSDNWMTWYELMNDESICKEIFENVFYSISKSILHKVKEIQNDKSHLENMPIIYDKFYEQINEV